MGTRKKGSELVFNLQWRNKPDNGGDKSNVIGMYDTPTTTSNFEMFKSYLLKNSGVAENDVKVTYITDCGQEWVIDSQEWFEIALSAFRLKARLGEVIFLKLDKIFNGRHQMTRKHSNDVETQFDIDSMGDNGMTPPEWFMTYMNQFKHDLVEEVTYAVSSNLSTSVKEKESAPIVISNSKKIKPDTSKRCKKHLVLGETVIDKELLKTLKYDRKLENKLDKLDAKTKKIKEKKQALMNKIETDEQRYFNKVSFVPIEFAETNTSVNMVPDGSGKMYKDADNNGLEAKKTTVSMDADNVKLLNGTAVNGRTCQRMMGGEFYLQTWEIINNGKVPWSPSTELRLTWGSAKLFPSFKTLRCPSLKPGERGTVSVTFGLPVEAGTYESYWNFYNENIRFGQALSCCFIVEEPLKIVSQQNSMSNNLNHVPKSEEEIKQDTVVTTGNNFCENRSLTPDQDRKRVQALIEEVFSSPNKLEVQPPVTFYTMNPGLIKFRSLGGEESPDLHNENMSKAPVNKSDQVSQESNLTTLQNENAAGLTSPVLNLTKRIEDIKLEDFSHPDSDSDWESVCSLEKHRLAEEIRSSNKYGINEKDLIVDLSMNSKETKIENNMGHSDEQDREKNANVVGNEDNNNNNGVSLDTSCTGSTFSMDSGYDVLQVPVCEEKEDSSGYVYITIDGNKLPVPRHILRPDFLLTAEEAPGPLISDEEKNVDKKIFSKDNSIEPAKTPETLQPTVCEPIGVTQDLNVLDSAHVTTCPLMVNSMSESTANSNRLFIFPQNNPGYEVLQDNDEDCLSACSMYDNEEVGQGYTWANSATQYRLADVQNVKRLNPVHIPNNPYGPLDQSRSPPCGTRHSAPASGQATSPPVQTTSTFATPTTVPPHYTQYAHVPNYQQSTTPTPLMTFSPMAETPSAPQQQRSSDHNVPVHILPENLVTGAVNVASSAINTARSVINMIVPPRSEPGKWVNGHWVTENPESLRAKNLIILADMGFWDADLNATLLARYNDDINRVINELLQ